MVTPRPSFLIVPGAWHPPEAYERLVKSLKIAGYSATVTSLPSCDIQDPQNATCSADAEAVRNEILRLINDGEKDLVIVCHSYGGIPGGGAAYGLSKTARAKDKKEGGIVGLIYVSGLIISENTSFLEATGGQYAPCVDTDQPHPNQCTVIGPKDILFNDLDDSDADYFTKLLRPTSMRAFESLAPPMGWADPDFKGHVAFIRCTKDHAWPLLMQDMFMNKSGVQWHVNDIETSHSPFASKPEELANLLGELAQQFIN